MSAPESAEGRRHRESELRRLGMPGAHPSAAAITHEDLVVLTAWLAERGYSASSVAYAVEKPHKYAAELSLAKAVLHHETSFKSGPVHRCQPSAADSRRWVCAPEWWDGEETICQWEWWVSDADQ